MIINRRLDIHLKIKALTPDHSGTRPVLVGYSLKNQGINTTTVVRHAHMKLDIHLDIKVLTPFLRSLVEAEKLDIHLNIKALTP